MYWQVIMENEEVILFAAVLVASLWLFIKRVYVERSPFPQETPYTLASIWLTTT